MKTIIDFRDPGSIPWRVVNDGVMGGLSESVLELSREGTAIFKGFVSLENNGGFASTRGDFEVMDLSGFEGVTLRVRGDGRSYQLRFRTDGSRQGMAYKSEFRTSPGEWMELSLPFSGFEPTVRGYRPPGVGPLDTARLRQMGFLIGDKREGPFHLEIAWVQAFGGGE